MKKTGITYIVLFFIILLNLFASGCDGNDQIIDIKKLNGYWEIKRVVLKDGTEKSYNFNKLIDYFEVKGDSTGIRKKMQPALTGRFQTTGNTEQFKIHNHNNTTFLEYKTPLTTYKKNILVLTEHTLQLEDSEGRMFYYEHYEKLEF